MPEIRIDPLTGQRAIIADAPGEAGSAPAPPDLAPTEPAADELPRDARVLTPAHPLLVGDAPTPPRSANPDLFWAGPAQGAHELIVSSPQPAATLAQLGPEGVQAAAELWRERMRAHPEAACLHLVVDEGEAAGAGGARSHAQLYALDFVPAAIARERERFGAYATRTNGGNLLGDLLQQEVRQRERIVAIDSEAVLMAPYGSRMPYQLMIVPRTPRPRFQDDGPTAAGLLHDALARLARRLGADPPLSLWVRTAPSGAEHFCWRIDILPRLRPASGLELGAGVGVNVVAPERAASELRDA